MRKNNYKKSGYNRRSLVQHIISLQRTGYNRRYHLLNIGPMRKIVSRNDVLLAEIAICTKTART